MVFSFFAFLSLSSSAKTLSSVILKDTSQAQTAGSSGGRQDQGLVDEETFPEHPSGPLRKVQRKNKS